MEFIIYSRRGCHLCEVMKDDLEKMGLENPDTGVANKISLINIDDDPCLKARYQNDVPVLVVDDVEICRHRLDADSLISFLEAGD